MTNNTLFANNTFGSYVFVSFLILKIQLFFRNLAFKVDNPACKDRFWSSINIFKITLYCDVKIIGFQDSSFSLQSKNFVRH